MSKIKDSDIRMNCPDKATCYEHLHNLEVLKAYRKECKLSKKYKECLQEIKTLLSQVDEYNWLHTGKHIYMDDRCISELKARIQAKINEVIGAE